MSAEAPGNGGNGSGGVPYFKIEEQPIHLNKERKMQSPINPTALNEAFHNITITDKHNGMVNTACTASAGRCSIIGPAGSAVIFALDSFPISSWHDALRKTMQFAIDCTMFCTGSASSGVGLIREIDGSLHSAAGLYGCSSKKQGVHIWAEDPARFNVTTDCYYFRPAFSKAWTQILGNH